MPEERKLNLWHGQVKPTVRVAGKGDPLVFLHGSFGPIWDAFLDALAQNHTVYAPSHPGTGPNDVDGVRAIDDMWDLVLYYYELFDQLKLQSPAVVGHSFGGMVAAEIAATDPSRVSKLTLIAPLGLWLDDAPIPLASALSRTELARRIFSKPDHPAAKLIFPNPSDTDALIRVTWSQSCANKFIWPIPDKGLKKRAHRIAAPALIVWGRDDKFIAPAYAEEFARVLPRTQIEMIDNASHMAPLERPDTVAAAIAKFFKG